MIPLFDGLKLAAGAILGGVVVYSYVQAFTIPAAHEDERNKLAAEALQKTIEVIQSREKTNVQISAGDAASLCRHLLVSEDDIRECVLGLAEAKPDAGNGGPRGTD